MVNIMMSIISVVYSVAWLSAIFKAYKNTIKQIKNFTLSSQMYSADVSADILYIFAEYIAVVFLFGTGLGWVNVFSDTSDIWPSVDTLIKMAWYTMYGIAVAFIALRGCPNNQNQTLFKHCLPSIKKVLLLGLVMFVCVRDGSMLIHKLYSASSLLFKNLLTISHDTLAGCASLIVGAILIPIGVLGVAYFWHDILQDILFNQQRCKN